MFHKSLINTLNKHIFLQYIFVFLPIIMIAIYGFAYMTDMLGIARSLAYNDTKASNAYSTNQLVTVDHTGTDDNGEYVLVNGVDYIDVPNVVPGYAIFYVQMYGENWFSIGVETGNTLTVDNCDLFSIVDYDDGVCTIEHDDISFDAESGDIICWVSISEDGLWRITFETEDWPYYDLEELYLLEIVDSSEDEYIVRIHEAYHISVDSVELNFCTSLPTSDVYYDLSSKTFITNVTKDYPWTFMLRANIFVVLLSTALYCTLLWKLSKDRELDLLKHQIVININIFAVSLLAVCVPFTLMML